MNVFGAEVARDELKKPGYFFKAVLNDSAATFFPGKIEHRTVKVAGLSYEDDYKGNALAAIITNGRIEIRNHRDFSASRVAAIVRGLLDQSDLEFLTGFSVQYKGEKIEV